MLSRNSSISSSSKLNSYEKFGSLISGGDGGVGGVGEFGALGGDGGIGGFFCT